MSSIRAGADRCVACGLCLPHCPTYRDSLNENESPRGRVALLRAGAEGRLPLNDRLADHIDGCLGCRACEAVCPSTVPYGALLKNGRALLAEARPPTPGDRLRRLLIRTSRWPRAFGFAYRLARRLAQLPTGAGAGPLMALRHAPTRARAPIPRGDTEGPFDVGLFLGCTADLDAPALNAAARILKATGLRVQVAARQECCGALASHAGHADLAATAQDRNRRAFAGGPPALVSLNSACVSELADYDRDRDQGFPAVFDIHRFLVEKAPLDRLALRPLARTIAIHEPCTLRNSLHGAGFVWELLAHIPGVRLIAASGNAVCCGAAGDFFLRRPRLAVVLGDDAVRAVAACRPDILVSSNIGCALHLAAALGRQGLALPVVHPLLVLAGQLPPSDDAC